jgi:hypothetical protein
MASSSAKAGQAIRLVWKFKEIKFDQTGNLQLKNYNQMNYQQYIPLLVPRRTKIDHVSKMHRISLNYSTSNIYHISYFKNINNNDNTQPKSHLHNFRQN